MSQIQPDAEYVRVALDLPIEAAYQYVLPPEWRGKVTVGSIVRVPVKARECRGVILEFEEKPATPRIKPIIGAVSAPFTLTAELIELGRWMADYYLAPLGDTLGTISFIGFADVNEPTERQYCLADFEYWMEHPGEAQGPDAKPLTANQRRVVEALLETGNDPTPGPLLARRSEATDAVIQGLVRRKLLERIEAATTLDDDYGAAPSESDMPPALTVAQKTALDSILASMRAREYGAFLLHGVTGSGKTEIYLQAIAEGLRQGRQAIVLAPEIALTPQTVDRFRARFGDVVGVYHHRQTLRQKFDLWRRIRDGEIKIVVGARSALFAPFDNLGVIVVDEEHSSSYKQDAAPRYNARDVALVRARNMEAVAILGSATPSLESYWNAQQKKYVLLELTERVGGAGAMPAIELIDMARELKKTHGNPGVLSDRLKGAIEKRLEAKEHALLLINRRGYASVSMCIDCETVERCSQCDASMTYHKKHDTLICHLCGERRRPAQVCPACGSKEMERLGIGTQKVEETLRAVFPAARTLRLDSDTARGRKAWIEAWATIQSDGADLILGTQMIAKGLHLERVTLVGVISADGALFQPDFRAAERTYSLLSQAAGRSGRGDTPGEVVIQSYSPGHYAIQLACAHDFGGFYEREMRLRRALRFPPIERLVALTLSAEDAETARFMARNLAQILRAKGHAADYESVAVLGPMPCPIERIRNKWRHRILLRAAQSRPMRELLREALKQFDRAPNRGKVGLEVDVDPQDLL